MALSLLPADLICDEALLANAPGSRAQSQPLDRKLEALVLAWSTNDICVPEQAADLVYSFFCSMFLRTLRAVSAESTGPLSAMRA